MCVGKFIEWKFEYGNSIQTLNTNIIAVTLMIVTPDYLHKMIFVERDEKFRYFCCPARYYTMSIWKRNERNRESDKQDCGLSKIIKIGKGIHGQERCLVQLDDLGPNVVLDPAHTTTLC